MGKFIKMGLFLSRLIRTFIRINFLISMTLAVEIGVLGVVLWLMDVGMGISQKLFLIFGGKRLMT